MKTQATRNVAPFSKRHPVLYVLACALICFSAVALGCAWLGKAAGIY